MIRIIIIIGFLLSLGSAVTSFSIYTQHKDVQSEQLDAEAKYIQVQDVSDSLRAQLKQKEARLSAMEDEMTRIEGMLEDYEDQISSKNSMIEDLESSVSDLRSQHLKAVEAAEEVKASLKEEREKSYNLAKEKKELASEKIKEAPKMPMTPKPSMQDDSNDVEFVPFKSTASEPQKIDMWPGSTQAPSSFNDMPQKVDEPAANNDFGPSSSISFKPVSAPEMKKEMPAMEKTESVEKPSVASSSAGDHKVLTYNTKFNFVVVNMGLKDGLKMGDEIEVSRGGQQIALTQVEKIYDKFSAATIIKMVDSNLGISEGDVARKI